MATYKKRKGYSTVAALCFTEAAETYHHWKVFSPGKDGMCMQFDKPRLLGGIDCPEVKCLPVDYIKIRELGTRPPTLNELPFSKRSAYSDEREFRILYCSKTEQVRTKDFSIAPPAIDRVIINPWLAEALADSVKQTINSISGFERLEVIQSTVTDSPAWRRFAERYA